MEKKSKILITVFILAILISILFTYKRSFVDRNFILIEEEVEEDLSEEGAVEEEAE